jgi:hypothetical protein
LQIPAHGNQEHNPDDKGYAEITPASSHAPSFQQRQGVFVDHIVREKKIGRKAIFPIEASDATVQDLLFADHSFQEDAA